MNTYVQVPINNIQMTKKHFITSPILFSFIDHYLSVSTNKKEHL